MPIASISLTRESGTLVKIGKGGQTPGLNGIKSRMLHRQPERVRTWGGEPRVESAGDPVCRIHDPAAVANPVR